MALSSPLDNRIREACASLLSAAPALREVPAADFVMEPPESIVIRELDIMTQRGRFRLAETMPAARPPFEWFYEITSEIDTGNDLRHYLVLEDSIVTAERRTLTPIDDEEAALILSDLDLARATL